MCAVALEFVVWQIFEHSQNKHEVFTSLKVWSLRQRGQLTRHVSWELNFRRNEQGHPGKQKCKVINLIALIHCVKSYIVTYKKLHKMMVLISYMIVQGAICTLAIIGSSKINWHTFSEFRVWPLRWILRTGRTKQLWQTGRCTIGLCRSCLATSSFQKSQASQSWWFLQIYENGKLHFNLDFAILPKLLT